MNASQRRDLILKRISESEEPLSAGALAKEIHISRQIIVGDVALLRAAGHEIVATPKGYILENSQGVMMKLAVSHASSAICEELYLIVDMGGEVIDVIIEHPVYGQLSGKLHLSSRYDVDQYVMKMTIHQVKPLSSLTDGLHIHTIRAENEIVLQRIVKALATQGFLYEKEEEI
jgi:transcriptional regulator of NAD metabolism